MSAPAVDLFEDRHHSIDHMDRPVGSLTAAAVALGVLALASWVAAVVTVRLNSDTGNTVVAVGLAAVISVCSVMCWCTSAIRHHNRCLSEALCHRIECDLELRRRVTDMAAPAADVGDNWRAYIAGRIDRDDDR